ncbi:MAG: hypothetical protein V1689_01170 [Pseudomonadota bacterium]
MGADTNSTLYRPSGQGGCIARASSRKVLWVDARGGHRRDKESLFLDKPAPYPLGGGDANRGRTLDNKLSEEVGRGKRYACPSGIPKGVLCEEFNPGEAGLALHRAPLRGIFDRRGRQENHA